MKKLFFALSLIFLLVPSISFASSLTVPPLPHMGYSHAALVTRFGGDELLLYNGYLRFRFGTQLYPSTGTMYSYVNGSDIGSAFSISAIEGTDVDIVSYDNPSTILFTANQPSGWVVPEPEPTGLQITAELFETFIASVIANGKIVLKNKPYLLEFSPEGWDGIAVQNILNRRYWGIDRSVSVPLSYVQDGAKILKHILLNKGIEESVYLVIAKQEIDYTPGVSYGYWYKQIYRGEVDFSTYDHSGVKVTCNTLEDGLPKYLKANENTTYELPMNVADAIFVKMDGIKLHESINYQIIDLKNIINE